MLVGVNALGLRPGFGGGIERYLRRMLAIIPTLQPTTRWVIFTDEANHDSFAPLERVLVPPAGMFGGASRLNDAVREARADVLFSPVDSAPLKCSATKVLFALDLRRFEPEHAPGRRGKALTKRVQAVCANAAAIVAPSEDVQRKSLYLLDVGLEKTVVAPLGVDDVFGRPQPRMIEPEYLLAVGDTHEFKNIPRLREVHAMLNKENPICLAVVGRPGEAEPADWGARVFRFEQLPAANLAALYQHCAAYIQPSLYEGSGVTVLEAMRAGAPVAAARVGGIPEVAGDVPFFFNPENAGSMAASVRRIFEETPAQRQKRTHPGERMAVDYTWEKCAWKTLGAFKKA